MKKLLFLSMIIIFVLIPTFALADMSAPSYIIYSAYVSNPYGAEYFNTTNDNEGAAGTIPFKTKIICYSTYNDEYLAFVLEGEDFSYESDKTKYIYKYNVTIDDLTQYDLEEKEKARTFSNTIIYNMPTDATKGEVLGMIPTETDITVQEYRVDEKATGLWNDWSEWYYTSYNGVNGWIKIDDFAFYHNDEDSYTAKNLLTKNGAFVPMFTPIKEYYNFGGGYFYKGIFYYEGEPVEYAIEEDIAREIKEEQKEEFTYEILFDGVSLYEQANLKSKKVVDSVPVGTILVGDYAIWGRAFDTWISVKYEGSIAWLYIGGLYSYRNKAKSEEKFESNKQYLREAEENNWDWINYDDYPTTIEKLKDHYNSLIKDGYTYSEDAIEESDATKKIGKTKIEDIASKDSGEEIIEPIVIASTSNGSLGTNEMIVAVVAIIGVVLILIATMVTIIVLINKKRK